MQLPKFEAMEASLDDISRLIRLVHEVCDRWDDPRVWREYFLHGACALLGGHAGMILADYGGTMDCFGQLMPVAVVGLPEAARQQLIRPHVAEWQNRPRAEAPGMKPLLDELARQRWVTASRDELTDDATYRASPDYVNLRKPLDLDDFILSIRFVDVPTRAEAINIDRPHGAPPFGPREVSLLKILHDEIAPLIGVRLATEEHLSRDGLSKRLRETLSLLLDGRSEKEVAASLHLGTRTVHDYVTALYQHFRVSSRAELLAYFIRRQPVLRSAASAEGTAETGNRHV
jgi:DNA-binding CsgD family transcriptional regulator